MLQACEKLPRPCLTMAPSTMKQWTITSSEKGFDGVEYGEVPVPKVGANDVLIKINGASLNYRDLIIPMVSLERFLPT